MGYEFILWRVRGDTWRWRRGRRADTLTNSSVAILNSEHRCKENQVLSELQTIVLHLWPDICAVFIYFLLFCPITAEQDDDTFSLRTLGIIEFDQLWRHLLTKCGFIYSETLRPVFIFSVFIEVMGKPLLSGSNVPTLFLLFDLGVTTLSWWPISWDATMILDGWLLQIGTSQPSVTSQSQGGLNFRRGLNLHVGVWWNGV